MKSFITRNFEAECAEIYAISNYASDSEEPKVVKLKAIVPKLNDSQRKKFLAEYCAEVDMTFVSIISIENYHIHAEQDFTTFINNSKITVTESNDNV